MTRQQELNYRMVRTLAEANKGKPMKRKVDTYADQLKTIQKKKSKTEKDKFGYTVPKKKSFVPPSVAIVKGIFGNQIDKLNLNRRMTQPCIDTAQRE